VCPGACLGCIGDGALGPKMLMAVGRSQVVVRQLRGESLSHGLIGTDPVRKLAVYLPAGYEGTAQPDPMIYYLPSPLAKFDEDFYRGQVRDLLDRAVAAGRSARSSLLVWIWQHS
jgi:hypothetical protein